MKMKQIFGMLLTLMMLPALSACRAQKTPAPTPAVESAPPQGIIAEGRLIPARDVTLAPAVRGLVEAVLVDEGDTVHKGDVLLRLSDSEQAQASLQSAQAELVAAQQAYDDFKRTADLAKAQAWQDYIQAQIARAEAQRAWDDLDIDALEDDVASALATVRDKEDDLEDAQDAFDKYKDLSEDNAPRKDAKEKLDEAQAAYDAAVADWEAAQHAIDQPRAALDAALAAEAEAKRTYENIVENGYDPDQEALLKARLDAAQAQVDAARRALEHYQIIAPFDGVVTRINLSRGELAGPETWAVQMADFSAWYVETTDLTELDVVHVREGEQVSIVPDALPDTTLTGAVESIARSYTLKGGDVLYTVKIRLEDGSPALRWGMTVEVTFPNGGE